MAHRCSHCQSTCVGYRASEPGPSPDIARMLATNDPPSASQEEEFVRIRIDGVKRLAELETLIGELQQALKGLMVERDALAWKVEHHRLVLNPVRRLPADILREIFLFACARTKYPSRFYLIPPSFLAAVCRSWNYIAVTSPELWRTCDFALPDKRLSPRGVASYEKACLMAGLSISRSAMCPLWLNLRLDDNLSYFHPSYPFLFAISGRIQGLRLSTSDTKFLEIPEFRHFAMSLTTLVHMDLHTNTNRDIALAALSLPRSLRHLSITPNAAFSNLEVNFNWSHLESLVLRVRSRGVSIQSILNILSKARNLRRLTFSNGDPKHILQSITTDSLVTLRHLTDLVVESSTPSLCDVLANVSTPSLERLVIRGGSREILPGVEEMLQKSGCTLRHLTLQSLRDEHGAVDTIDVADSLIRQCGSLRELSLLGIDTGTESITRLLLLLVESLPQLRVLALDISCVHDFRATSQITMADGILAFLESRRRSAEAPDTGAASCVDLESFTLHAPTQEVFNFTEVQQQRIRELRASGLLLYICRYTQNDPRLY